MNRWTQREYMKIARPLKQRFSRHTLATSFIRVSSSHAAIDTPPRNGSACDAEVGIAHPVRGSFNAGVIPALTDEACARGKIQGVFIYRFLMRRS
jgi:hypothetical protein